MKFFIVLIVLILVPSALRSQDQTLNMQARFIIPNCDKVDNDCIRVVSYISDKGALLIALENDQGDMLDAVAVANSSVIGAFESTKPVQLNDGAKEYVIETAVNNSTYGARNLVVVWKDSRSWRLTRLGDYSRVFLEDRNNDQVYEIVEYYLSQNENGDVYNFQKGYLLKK